MGEYVLYSWLCYSDQQFVQKWMREETMRKRQQKIKVKLVYPGKKGKVSSPYQICVLLLYVKREFQIVLHYN